MNPLINEASSYLPKELVEESKKYRYSQQDVIDFIKKNKYSDSVPTYDEYVKFWGNAKSLKAGAEKFRRTRKNYSSSFVRKWRKNHPNSPKSSSSMLSPTDIAWQNNHSALSKSAADAYADNWN